MSRHNAKRGPSSSLIAWRRFLTETVLCVVLIGSIVGLALRLSIDPFASFGIAALTTAALRIVWRP